MPIVSSSAWQRLGLSIGHATNVAGATGCTVVRGTEQPFRCAAALIGRASGSRELATCAPEHLVDRTDAILLTGGSAYGLDAAAGVMRWMEERSRGFSVGRGVVPIVPAAVIFDLAPLGRFDARPTPDMAYDACESARFDHVEEGCVGAGTGALVGKCAGIEFAMKGGVGVGSVEGGGVLAAAIAVVNAFGDVRDGHGEIIAGARSPSGGFVDAERVLRGTGTPTDFPFIASDGRRNTTLAVVAVNALLTKGELSQLAQAATAAFHRRITPCGTMFDGDILFTLCPVDTADPVAPGAVPLARVEAMAVAAIEIAIERGVTTATGRDGFPGLADRRSAS
ncbi:MAG: P1 family peptidase [Gemmatimonas sp.]